MGAWSADAFGNDTGCDWAGDFCEEPNLGQVRTAISAVIETEDYLDADVSCECLVACEVVARLKGHWGVRNSYSEEVDQWVTAHPMDVPGDLVDQAVMAIGRILGSDSELTELWDEDGPHAEWHQAMDDLLDRLRR